MSDLKGKLSDLKGKISVGPAGVIRLLFLFSLALSIGNIARNVFDTDEYFLAATGREILKNGILYTNPFFII